MNILAVSPNLISSASNNIKDCFINEPLNHLYSSVTDNHDSVLPVTRMRWFGNKDIKLPTISKFCRELARAGCHLCISVLQWKAPLLMCAVTFIFPHRMDHALQWALSPAVSLVVLEHLRMQREHSWMGVLKYRTT